MNFYTGTGNIDFLVFNAFYFKTANRIYAIIDFQDKTFMQELNLYLITNDCSFLMFLIPKSRFLKTRLRTFQKEAKNLQRL